MNIALIAAPRVWTALQGLLRWLAPGHRSTNRRPALAPVLAATAHTVRPHRTGPACAPATRLAQQRRPLRIVRVMEAGQAPAQVGRMVISGRMADVCAELDRLAACEAAWH